MQAHIKDAVVAAWQSAWDHGDLDAFDHLVTDDYVRVSTGSGRQACLADLKQEIADVRAAFPDLRTVIDHVVVEGDTAAIFWHSTGSFTEPLLDVPPTGSTVHTRGSNLVTIRDGKIAREEVTWDASELLADSGLPSLSSAFEPHDTTAVVDEFSRLAPREMLKAFNRQFVTGVTVVTTKDVNGDPLGLAVNSYASLSLDPPLVLVCVQKSSSTYPALFRARHLGINILSNNQQETLRVFASKTADKFSQVRWHEAPAGSPLLDGSSASIEVEIKERFQVLTHTLFIGRVRYVQDTDHDPILYRAGKFFDGSNLTALD